MMRTTHTLTAADIETAPDGWEVVASKGVRLSVTPLVCGGVRVVVSGECEAAAEVRAKLDKINGGG